MEAGAPSGASQVGSAVWTGAPEVGGTFEYVISPLMGVATIDDVANEFLVHDGQQSPEAFEAVGDFFRRFATADEVALLAEVTFPMVCRAAATLHADSAEHAMRWAPNRRAFIRQSKAEAAMYSHRAATLSRNPATATVDRRPARSAQSARRHSPGHSRRTSTSRDDGGDGSGGEPPPSPPRVEGSPHHDIGHGRCTRRPDREEGAR